MQRILLFTAIGVANYGDELICRSLQRFYLNELPDSHVTCFSNNLNYSLATTEENAERISYSDVLSQFVHHYLAPRGLKNDSGWDAVLAALRTARSEGSEFERILRAKVAEADLIHFGGGGYIYYAFEHVLVMIAVLVALAKELDKPFMFSGVSLTPFPQPFREIMIRILDGAVVVDVRDDSSRDILTDVGAKGNITCDDAFYLAQHITAQGNDCAPSPIGGGCSVNLLLNQDLMTNPNTVSLCRAIRQSILERAVNDIHFQPCAFLSNGQISDLDALGALDLPQGAMLDPVTFVFRKPLDAVVEFAQAVGSIGTRFHFAVLSFLLLRPAMTPLYAQADRRMIFLHDRLDSDWIHPVQDVSPFLIERFLRDCVDGTHREYIKVRRDKLFREKRDTLRDAASSAGLSII